MADLDAELANFEAELATLAAATETVENVSRLEMKFGDGFCVSEVFFPRIVKLAPLSCTKRQGCEPFKL